MLMGIEITDRQLLHVAEEFITKFLQSALGYEDHKQVIDISRDDTDDIESCDLKDCL